MLIKKLVTLDRFQVKLALIINATSNWFYQTTNILYKTDSGTDVSKSRATLFTKVNVNNRGKIKIYHITGKNKIKL